MAWLERHPTSGHFHLCFRWNGKRKRRSLSTDDTKAAEAIRLRFEENVALLERGRLELPPAADIMTFLLSDGKLHGFREVADPDPGPLEVEQNGGRFFALPLDFLQVGDPFGPNFRCPVGGIDPHDIDTGVEHAAHLLGLFPGRAKGGHDLGSATLSWQSDLGLLNCLTGPHVEKPDAHGCGK